MKRLISWVLITLFTFQTPFVLLAEEANAPEEGFGLQAAIFSIARNNIPNLDINLTRQADYPMTPGDIYTLTINEGLDINGRINANLEYPVQLSQNYTLDLPIIGTINCAGKNIPQLQTEISRKIREKIPVQYTNFSLKAPAQFQVFVHGGVNLPGEITGNAIFRVIDAIAMSGGFKPGASYRLIELHRNNQVITLDLSSYYQSGDYESNPYLQPGDRIFIPRAQVTTIISGEIMYPGAYELLENETLEHLLAFSGGLKPGGDSNRITISRSGESGEANMLTYSTEDRSAKIKNGDIIRIPSAIENNPRVIVEGAFYGTPVQNTTPSITPTTPIRLEIPYAEGMTLLNLLDMVGGPTAYAKDTGSFITTPDGESRMINLHELWNTRDSSLDVTIPAGTQVFLPIQKMKVFIAGEVNNPGMFDFFTEVTIQDYLLMAGGPTKNASTGKVTVIDENGATRKLSFSDIPQPGDIITVEPNFAISTDEVFQNVFIFTSIITSVLTFVGLIIEWIPGIDWPPKA